MSQVETSCTVYLKGSTPKCSTLDSSTHEEHWGTAWQKWMWTITWTIQEQTAHTHKGQVLGQVLVTKAIKQNHNMIKLIYPFFQFLHYPWWSSGTSPADNFMGLFLPGCCSLTKVCPVEERSVMEISNGTTSDKLPPVTLKFEVSVSFLGSHSLMWGMPLNPLVSLYLFCSCCMG